MNFMSDKKQMKIALFLHSIGADKHEIKDVLDLMRNPYCDLSMAMKKAINKKDKK